VGEEFWGLLGFVVLMCVWVYFCCRWKVLVSGIAGAGAVGIGSSLWVVSV
jgi:hypothetical protein